MSSGNLTFGEFDHEECFVELKKEVAFSLALLVGIVQVSQNWDVLDECFPPTCCSNFSVHVCGCMGHDSRMKGI